MNERASPHKSSLKLASSFGNRLNNAEMGTFSGDAADSMQPRSNVRRAFDPHVSDVDRSRRSEDDEYSVDIPNPRRSPKKEVRFS